MSKKAKRLLWLFCSATIILLAGVVGYMAALRTPSTLQKPQAAGAAGEGDKTVLNCKIVKQYQYLLCGHEMEESENIGRDLVGLTKAEIASKVSGFKLSSFSPTEVVFTKRLNQYCPEHYILRLHGNKLDLTRNVQYTEQMETLYVYTIDTSDLDAELLEILTHGKVFPSRNEAEEYTENELLRKTE